MSVTRIRVIPASRLDPKLAAMVAPITTLAVWETEVTAVEGGRYLTTWEAAVLGLPAKLVVTPASTDTLQTDKDCFSNRVSGHSFTSFCNMIRMPTTTINTADRAVLLQQSLCQFTASTCPCNNRNSQHCRKSSTASATVTTVCAPHCNFSTASFIVRDRNERQKR